MHLCISIDSSNILRIGELDLLGASEAKGRKVQFRVLELIAIVTRMHYGSWMARKAARYHKVSGPGNVVRPPVVRRNNSGCLSKCLIDSTCLLASLLGYTKRLYVCGCFSGNLVQTLLPNPFAQ